jgi:hypothetical protein
MPKRLLAVFSLVLASTCIRADTIKINSPSFDFVERVNYGSSSIFLGDSQNFSVYSAGDDNSAQQTWFAVSNAVATATAGRKINSATLNFRSGYSDSAARTVYLARTALGVTASANKTTYNGSSAYPSAPGTSASFGGGGYLLQPITINIDSSGSGSVDVTAWVTNYPGQVWFLTGSPAPGGTSVSSVSGANWGKSWHWQNALVVNGNTESPVQLVLNVASSNASPSFSSPPLSRAAGYANESLSIGASASGATPMYYQWLKNGTNISGATSATLNFNSLALADAGDYQVIVSNVNGTITSPVMDLTVIAPPNLANFVQPAGETTRYSAQGDSVIGHNQGRFFNRPLYINNTSSFVLAGDKPMLKFCTDGDIHGKFFVGITRGGTTKWLHDCADITAGFQPDHTTWRVTDSAFPNLVVRLEAASLAGNAGWSARATVTGAQSGDKLVWAFGGASTPGGSLNTDLDPYRIGNAALLAESFSPSSCASDSVQILSGAMAGAFSVLPTSSSSTYTLGRCSVGTNYVLADASAWTTPASLVASSASTEPIVCGQIPIDNTPTATWSFFRVTAIPATMPDYTEPTAAFASGLLRSADFASRLYLQTPDARFNAEAAMIAGAIDGAWYGQTFHHGAMAWNVALLGWRTTIGSTMLGWHDRAQMMSDHYTALQITSTANSSSNLDTGRKLVLPAADSIFYGRGHISQDSGMYDMQSQFFDQVLQDWRWRLSDDAAYEARLRTAAELHLQWAHDCFDPDDDGTYESVLNTWPTDSVWANGGGTPEETGYIYRAHAVARDLATRAGDSASVAAHQAAMDKIKAGLFSQLWNTNSGHFVFTREQGGRQRQIDNPWLYSLCLPIEAAMLTPEQCAEDLYYTEYGLQNDRMSSGGRRVWTSNFTPSIWSTRILWPGDNYMLAYSYMQAGFAVDGWDILSGTFLHAGFDNVIPGDAADFFGGTDFGDCIHPFTRTVVEGLFGYQPDFPNGFVRLAPQIPVTWTNAAMKTPDVRLRYNRTGNTTTLEARLQRSAIVNVKIPVRASGVSSVTVNGVSTPFQTTNSFGCTLVSFSTPATAGTNLVFAVTTTDNITQVDPVAVEAPTGSAVNLSVSGATMVSFSDPQGALNNAVMSGSAITATLSTNLGYHRVFARVTVGNIPQTRIFNLHILDVSHPSTSFASVPSGAAWSTVDMSAQLVTNITTIYQQNYASPRPASMSARVGTDGFSPWAFTYWGISAPTISTNNVPSLLSPTNSSLLVTPQGVPFRWGGAKNVAFASLWSNWTNQVTVPVNQSAEAAWFLICGSTTILQCRIPNAVLHLKYTDNSEDRLELIPPYNYWNLSPINGRASFDQYGASDYTQSTENYMVPKPWPMTVQLGSNCRALLLNHKLQPGKMLQQVTLEALSQESVIGLMGVTLMNPPAGIGALKFNSLPQNQTVPRRAAAAFSVSADGVAPLSYRWFKVGAGTPVAQTQTLEFPSVAVTDYGSYQVVVSNFSGAITSAPVALTEASVNLANQATATASAVWNNDAANNGPQLAIDGNMGTRWASGPAGQTNAWLELDFPQPVSFNQIYLSEAFDRVQSFALQIWDGALWQTLVNGTTIGANYTANFSGVTTTKVLLNIFQSTDAPTFWEFQVNYIPTSAPILNFARNGNNVRLTWQNGFLQTASSLQGLWADILGAVPPYDVSFVNSQGFFRTRQ